MKVSVITVCFNAERTIERTICSVRDQKGVDLEYIVVDGGSSDRTNSIIDKYNQFVGLHISEHDNGAYDAMNKGLHLATGELITFLNADDAFTHGNVLKNVVEVFSKDLTCQIVFGDVQFWEKGNLVRHYSSKHFRPWLLRFGWMPPHPGSVAKKELYKMLGGFDTSFKISADYEMFVRWLSVAKVEFRRIDDVLVNMEMGGLSTESWRSRVLLNVEIVKACNQNGLYTNLLFLTLKVPFKLLELRRPKLAFW